MKEILEYSLMGIVFILFSLYKKRNVQQNAKRGIVARKTVFGILKNESIIVGQEEINRTGSFLQASYRLMLIIGVCLLTRGLYFLVKAIINRV